MEDFVSRRRINKEAEKKKEQLRQHVSDWFETALSSSQRSSSAIQPIINIQVTLNTDPLSTDSTKMSVPVVKKEDPLKSEFDRNTSIKSEVTETDDIKIENIKRESACNTGEADEKDSKMFIHKGIELDGKWRHVDVELLPQTTTDDDIMILQTDMPIQTESLEDKWEVKSDKKPLCIEDPFGSKRNIVKNSPCVEQKLMEREVKPSQFSRISRKFTLNTDSVDTNIDVDKKWRQQSDDEDSKTTDWALHDLRSKSTFGEAFIEQGRSFHRSSMQSAVSQDKLKESGSGYSPAVHSSKFALIQSPMPSPIILPARLRLETSPPQSSFLKSDSPKFAADVDNISVNLEENLALGDKKTSQPKDSLLEKPIFRKKTQRRKLWRSGIVIPKAYQKYARRKKSINPTVTETSNEEQVKLTSTSDNSTSELTVRHQISTDSEPQEKDIVDPAVTNTNKPTRLSSVLTDPEMFSNIPKKNVMVSDGKNTDRKSSVKLPSDLCNVSPGIFDNMDNTTKEEYLPHGHGNDSDKTSEILGATNSTENITTALNANQESHDVSAILIDSSEDDNNPHKARKSSQSSDKEVDERNVEKIKYIPLPGNKDTILVNFGPKATQDHDYGMNIPPDTPKVGVNVPGSSSIHPLNNPFGNDDAIPLFPTDVASENESEVTENSSPVFGSKLTETNVQPTDIFNESIIERLPSAQSMLFSPNGDLQKMTYTTTMEGASLTTVAKTVALFNEQYPKTSTPDIESTEPNANTSLEGSSSLTGGSINTSESTSDLKSTETSKSETISTQSSSEVNQSSSNDKSDDVIVGENGEVVVEDSSVEEANGDNQNQVHESVHQIPKKTEEEGSALDEDVLLRSEEDENNSGNDFVIDSEKEDRLLNDQSTNEYEASDEATLEKIEHNPKKKQLKSPKYRNKNRPKADSTHTDGKYRLPAFSVLAQSILGGNLPDTTVNKDESLFNTVHSDIQELSSLQPCYNIAKSGTKGNTNNDACVKPADNDDDKEVQKKSSTKRKMGDGGEPVQTYSLPIRTFKAQETNPVNGKPYKSLKEDDFFSGKY